MASKARDVYPQQGGSFQFCKRLPGRVSWYLFLGCNLVKIVGVDHVSTGDVDICMYVHILIIYIYISKGIAWDLQPTIIKVGLDSIKP